MTRAGLTSAAARSSPGCKLLLSVGEVMLSHGLSLGCNKLRLSAPPQGVADSKGHGGDAWCQRHTESHHLPTGYTTGINKPTFSWQVSTCQAPAARPLNRPSPLSTLPQLRPACCPARCTAISPSAAVSL